MTDRNTLPQICISHTNFHNSCLLHFGHKENEKLPPFENKYILGNDIIEVIKEAFSSNKNLLKNY